MINNDRERVKSKKLIIKNKIFLRFYNKIKSGERELKISKNKKIRRKEVKSKITTDYKMCN